jgi:hypothetical protein
MGIITSQPKINNYIIERYRITLLNNKIKKILATIIYQNAVTCSNSLSILQSTNYNSDYITYNCINIIDVMNQFANNILPLYINYINDSFADNVLQKINLNYGANISLSLSNTIFLFTPVQTLLYTNIINAIKYSFISNESLIKTNIQNIINIILNKSTPIVANSIIKSISIEISKNLLASDIEIIKNYLLVDNITNTIIYNASIIIDESQSAIPPLVQTELNNIMAEENAESQKKIIELCNNPDIANEIKIQYLVLYQIDLLKLSEYYNIKTSTEFNEKFNKDYNTNFPTEYTNRYNNEYSNIFNKKLTDKLNEEYQDKFNIKYNENFDKDYIDKFDKEFIKQFNKEYPAKFETDFNLQYNKEYLPKFNDLFKTKFNDNYKTKFENEFNQQFNKEYISKFNSKFDIKYKEDYINNFNKEFDNQFKIDSEKTLNTDFNNKCQQECSTDGLNKSFKKTGYYTNTILIICIIILLISIGAIFFKS